MQRIAFVIFTTILSGCTVVPSVTYTKVTDASKVRVADSFYLNATRLVITPVKPTEKDKEGTISIMPELYEYTELGKIGIIPTNNVFKSVKVNITKVENTDRVSSIGVDTTENLKNSITTIGGVVTKMVGLGAAPTDGPMPTCEVGLSKEITLSFVPFPREDKGKMVMRFDDDNPKSQCITIEYEKAPPDAITVDKLPWDTESNNYYYSSCRYAKVSIEQPGKSPVVKNIRVASPDRLQYVQYPFKGTVSMHSQCGVSVKTEANPNSLGGVEAFGELLKQVEAIKAAGSSK